VSPEREAGAADVAAAVSPEQTPAQAQAQAQVSVEYALSRAARQVILCCIDWRIDRLID
jgi:hypothetical protein